MKVQVQVTVEKEIYDVGQLLADIIVGLKAKKPLLQIAGEELTKLEAAVGELSALAGDVKDDKAAALKALTLPLEDAVIALLAPAPAAAPAAQ